MILTQRHRDAESSEVFKGNFKKRERDSEMKRIVLFAVALLFAFAATAAASTDDSPGFARNGKTLTGSFPSTGITIEAGATVTFAGVYAECLDKCKAGAVECLGDATIILAPNTRNVASNYMTCASAIFVPAGHTLTIKGEGSLEAVSVKDYCSGIGACSKWLGMDKDKGRCGNIVIAGGKGHVRSGLIRGGNRRGVVQGEMRRHHDLRGCRRDGDRRIQRGGDRRCRQWRQLRRHHD